MVDVTEAGYIVFEHGTFDYEQERETAGEKMPADYYYTDGYNGYLDTVSANIRRFLWIIFILAAPLKRVLVLNLSIELVIAKQNCRKCDIAYFCGGGCRAEEDIDNNICAYNCNYFRFALEYFGGKLLL